MNSVMLNNLGLKHQWLQRYRSEKSLVCYKDSITFRYNLKNNCNCAKKVLRERSTGPTKRGRTDNEEVKIIGSDKPIEFLPQTQIFLSQYFCNLMMKTFDILNLDYLIYKYL